MKHDLIELPVTVKKYKTMPVVAVYEDVIKGYRIIIVKGGALLNNQFLIYWKKGCGGEGKNYHLLSDRFNTLESAVNYLNNINLTNIF